MKQTVYYSERTALLSCQLPNITKSTISQLSITLCVCVWTAAVRVTFAFGAFLAPPLEPASDQAVIGAQILCTVGEKGHGLFSTYTAIKSTKRLSNSLDHHGPNTTSAAGISLWTHAHGLPVLHLWQPALSHLSSLCRQANDIQNSTHLQRFFVSTLVLPLHPNSLSPPSLTSSSRRFSPLLTPSLPYR